MYNKGDQIIDITDPKLNNVLVARLINQIMRKGKRMTAQKIVSDCFDLISDKTKKDPLDVLEEAVRNVAPSLEVKAKRVGGANYQVPVPVMGERRITLAFRWILAAARAKKGKRMAEGMAFEVMDASRRQGAAIRKREDVHKMAEANKAFAHFA
ncbi:MAG: 30S ribosomal protein S7 [Patescibacteria group bacterium]|nr:30S ribosomal protein S7 [Patescibacteria group bacterium]